MSALKPGWADIAGKQSPAEPDGWSRLRATGAKPFRLSEKHTQASRLRGARKRVKEDVRKLDRVLPPIEEDDP